MESQAALTTKELSLLLLLLDPLYFGVWESCGQLRRRRRAERNEIIV